MSATSLLGYCSRTMFGAPGGAVGGGVAAAAAGMPGATWANAPGAAPRNSNATQKNLSTGLVTGSQDITISTIRLREFANPDFAHSKSKLLDAQYLIVVGELHVSRVDRYRAANSAFHSSNCSRKKRKPFCITDSSEAAGSFADAYSS